MPKGVQLTLRDATGALITNATNIQACWWDVAELADINSTPIGRTRVATTNASGVLYLDLDRVSGLNVGDYGYLVLYQLDAANHRNSPTFAGRVLVENIAAGVDMYYYDPGWTRPAAWLPLTVPGPSEQRFVGLHAVYEENANFVALSAEGAYVINWGDGTGNQNFASGAVAQTNILWANAAPTSDVGIAEAVPCTFQDAGDTVTVPGHNFMAGEKVAFNVINSTTGISTYTTYWVRDVTADTFRVAATQFGPALPLTTNGTGSVYRPKYRQVIVTLTMQSGQTLTALNLHQKHSQSGLQTYSSGFLDIALAGPSLTDLRIGVQTPGSMTQTIRFDKLERVNIVRSNLKQCEYLFYNCRNLRSIVDIATSTDPASTAAVTFQDAGDTVTHTAHGRINGESVIFSSINSTTGITTYTRYFIVNRTTNTYQLATSYNGAPVALTTNGSGTAVYGTNFKDMFRGCQNLTSVPLFNTAAGTSFEGMFRDCYSLTSVPLLNTAAGTSFAIMFTSCYSLTSVPLLNTAAGVDFNHMFNYCISLTSVPLLNTAAGVNLGAMFNGCYALRSVPQFNTAANYNFAFMFGRCHSLTSVPPLNTAVGTNFYGMFYECRSLTTIPMLNTAAGVEFQDMFYDCTALTSVPLLNVAAGTNFANMFANCPSLEVGALSGTRYSISYADCKLSGAELNRIYSNLGAPAGGAQTITVTNNWGTASDNPALAPTGWTVVGS